MLDAPAPDARRRRERRGRRAVPADRGARGLPAGPLRRRPRLDRLPRGRGVYRRPALRADRRRPGADVRRRRDRRRFVPRERVRRDRAQVQGDAGRPPRRLGPAMNPDAARFPQRQRPLGKRRSRRPLSAPGCGGRSSRRARGRRPWRSPSPGIPESRRSPSSMSARPRSSPSAWPSGRCGRSRSSARAARPAPTISRR